MTTPEPSATLIMESHGLAPDTRSTSFGSFGVWSKLYQLGACYLDLVLQLEGGARVLRGALLGRDGEPLDLGGSVVLQPQDEPGPPERARLGPAAAFAFPIDHGGSYRLTLDLDGASYRVPEIVVR